MSGALERGKYLAVREFHTSILSSAALPRFGVFDSLGGKFKITKITTPMSRTVPPISHRGNSVYEVMRKKKSYEK